MPPTLRYRNGDVESFTIERDESLTIDSTAFSIDTDRTTPLIAPSFNNDISNYGVLAKLSSESDSLNRHHNIIMEVNSLETWFVDKAHDLFLPEEVGEMVAEGGFQRLRHCVLEDTSEDVAEEYESCGDHIRAFNMVTMEWPHDARAYLAAYEYRYNEHDNDDYRNQLEEFAEAVGVLGYDTMQSELTWFYGGNPYTDPNLTDEEAKAVLVLRANDVNEDVIEDIPDAGNFIGWYKKTGDAEAASRACQFDSDLPELVMPKLAEPDEWNDLDPEDIESEVCVVCNKEYYRVEHHEIGETWIAHDGSVEDYAFRLDTDCPFTYESPSEFNLFCAGCHESWENDEHVVTYFNGEEKYRLGYNRSVLKDYGKGDELSFEPLDNETAEEMKNVLNSPPDDFFVLEATDRASSSIDAQEEYISELLYRPEQAFDDGPVFLQEQPHFSGDRRSICLPRFNPMVAKQGKEALEEAESRANNESGVSQEGLEELFG